MSSPFVSFLLPDCSGRAWGLVASDRMILKKRCLQSTSHPPQRDGCADYCKPGTRCITKINNTLWEGRYFPRVNGKRIVRNVYAATEEKCELRLTELIKKMKKELEPLRAKEKAC